MPRIKKETKTVKKNNPKKSGEGLTIPVYNLEGKEVKTLDVPKEIFSVKPNPKLLAQYVRVYLTNNRQGTASTKTRGEVRGSTRKIYRQKGTGRARHGDIKAPIFVGGGVVGGPKPKNYHLKMNKKQKKLALFNALTIKFKNKEIGGLSEQLLKIDVKTKLMVQFLKSLDLERSRTLIVLAKMEKNNLILASRNIKNITLLGARSLNPYEILKNKKILFVEEALQVVKLHFLHEN